MKTLPLQIRIYTDEGDKIFAPCILSHFNRGMQ